MKPWWRLALIALLVGCGLAAQAGVARTARAQDNVNVDPADLVVSIQLTPAVPAVNEQVTVDITVENVGDLTAQPAAGHQIVVEVYYYTAAPPGAGDAGFPAGQFPPIAAGGSAGASDQHAFDTAGCSNFVGVWVDRENFVPEGNDGNNFAFVPVCVGGVPQCVSADIFEADNTCATAKWLQEAAPQSRDLCNPTDPNAADTDWVKFTGFAGVQYTVSASKPPTSSANALVTIFPSCSGAALTGPSATQAGFTVANSGVYYAKVERQGGATTSDSPYTLAVASNTGLTDAYEPDDTCATARDIVTTDTRQTHRFNKVNDEDWVRFTAHAGESFVVATDQVGPGANPVLTLADGCAGGTQPLSAVQEASSAAGDATISGSTPLDKVYYVRARNANGSAFGAGMTYALRVKTTACAADGFEDDDASAQARTLALGAPQPGRTACPAGDEDWLKMSLTAGKTYVLETSLQGANADTVLTLFAPNGAQIGESDDFGLTPASRIALKPAASGVYTARVRHADAGASGPGTTYTVALREGFCVPDAFEGSAGNNGPGDARPAQFGATATGNFCADALNPNLGDQDWLTFNGVPNGKYTVKTLGLGLNSDTVVELYSASGALVATSDDASGQLATVLNYTASAAGPLYARVLQFNTNVNGALTDYQVQVSANEPPTPPPTPTPTPLPPPPTPTPNPASAQTLIVTNRARLVALYGAPAANALMNKLFALADNPDVKGAVIQVDTNPNVNAAYAEWLADLGSVPKANAVAAAVRGQLMTFLIGSSVAKNVVIVGSDDVIPFRRVLDLVPPQGQTGGSIEQNYAVSVTANSAVRAALAQNMILTDDYFVDKEPGAWKDKKNNTHELYLPDFAVARLIETPAEITGVIDQFLAGHTIAAHSILITGYDFVQDSADTIETFYHNDAATTATIIGPFWQKSQLVTAHLNTAFDITSLNGHSKHTALGTADNQEISAAEVAAASANMAGKLIYSLGCHGGLNDPGVLDLPQAYLQKKATYIGNTGFGWGGGGVVYSEALYRNLTRELLRELKAQVGPSLSAAKLKYYSRAQVFGPYDAKILMQTTLYGLPMIEVTSGGNLQNGDDFPSAGEVVTPPSSFSSGVAAGRFGYALNSSASFGSNTGPQGTILDLDDNVVFAAGEPVQPTYFGGASAPAAGTLRGVLFISGTFTTTGSVNPVIALADNEYVTDKSEPAFGNPGGWYPSLPFVIRNGDDISASVDSLVLSLGQFNAGDAAVVAAATTGTQRVYDDMAFSTFYSFSADEVAPAITYVDGVLNVAANTARVKVKANDASGVVKVTVSYTAGQNQWQSKELAYDANAQAWLGTIPATQQTTYFVQAVDGAGNVAANDNKGRYFPLPPRLPLAQGAPFAAGKIFLPVVTKK